MVQAKLAETRERRCDSASTHAETRHYPPGVTVRLSTSGKCPTKCWHGEPKNQQQGDDRDRNSPTVHSRILAIVHPGMIPGRCALHGMCSTLKDQVNADLPEVFKV
jgi:hypothetical protein